MRRRPAICGPSTTLSDTLVKVASTPVSTVRRTRSLALLTPVLANTDFSWPRTVASLTPRAAATWRAVRPSAKRAAARASAGVAAKADCSTACRSADGAWSPHIRSIIRRTRSGERLAPLLRIAPRSASRAVSRPTPMRAAAACRVGAASSASASRASRGVRPKASAARRARSLAREGAKASSTTRPVPSSNAARQAGDSGQPLANARWATPAATAAPSRATTRPEAWPSFCASLISRRKSSESSGCSNQRVKAGSACTRAPPAVTTAAPTAEAGVSAADPAEASSRAASASTAASASGSLSALASSDDQPSISASAGRPSASPARSDCGSVLGSPAGCDGLELPPTTLNRSRAPAAAGQDKAVADVTPATLQHGWGASSMAREDAIARCPQALAPAPLPLAGRGWGWGRHTDLSGRFAGRLGAKSSGLALAPPSPTLPREGEGSSLATASFSNWREPNKCLHPTPSQFRSPVWPQTLSSSRSRSRT